MNGTTEISDHPILSEEEYAEAYGEGFESTRRFLLSRGIEPARAEEFAQAAWARGWERRDSLRDPNRVVEWVNSIALNLFRNRLRRQKKVEELPMTLPSKDRVTLAPVEVEQGLKVCNAIERSILIERYVSGYSSQEVAERRDMSAGAVRVRTLRAKRKVLSVLRPQTQPPAAAA